MPLCEPPASESGDGAGAAFTVLAIGAAVAVVSSAAGDTAAARDRQAQSALRHRSGRHDIAIGRRPSGRPRLLQPYPELGVSLSHRDDLLLAGFSPTAAVGVDLELDLPDNDGPVFDYGRLAADHYSPAEAVAIARLGAAAGRDAFLRLWVAKEAALKITGRGIHDGLAEPDCGHLLETLAQEGCAVVSLQRSPRLPAVRLSVCRVLLPRHPAIYCALAVAA